MIRHSLLLICLIAAIVGSGSTCQTLKADEIGELTQMQKKVQELAAAGRFREAEPLAEQALARVERSFPTYTRAISNYCTDLGDVYYGQNKFAQAETQFKRALAIREQEFGNQHPMIVTSLIKLGLAYKGLARYKEAEELYKRSIAIQIKFKGPDDFVVGAAYNNLAGVYDDLGRYSEAEPLYKRALEIYRKALGDRHLDVASVLNNLANALKNLSRYTEAEQTFLQSLEIREQGLGRDHLLVALTLNNLAGVYQAQGRFTEAESLFNRSLTIKEKSLDPMNSDIAIGLNNVANLYLIQGRYSEAEPLLQRAIKIYEKSLGAQHPRVAFSLNNLANVYEATGRYADAESLLKRALKLNEAQLGLFHPNVAGTLNNLTTLFRNQGRYAEAQPYCQRALEIRKKSLSNNHPDIAQSLNGLGLIMYFQRRYQEAIPLYKEASSIYEKSVGAEHPMVGAIANNLALVFDAQGQPTEAEQMYKKAIAINEKAYGDQHPEVAIGLHHLANLYRKTSRLPEAKKTIDRALGIEEAAQVSPSDRSDSRLLRARIEWQLGEKKEGLADIREALKLAEQARGQTSGASKERAETFARFAGGFEQMVSWQLELGDTNEALQVMDRSHARSLLDEMNRAGSDLNAGRSLAERQALRKKEAELQSRVAQLSKQLEIASPANRDQYAKALAKARSDLYEQYRDEQNSSSVVRTLLTNESGPIAISDIQRVLIPDNGLALVYMFGEDWGRVIVLDGHKSRNEALNVPESSAKLLGTTPGPLTAHRLQEILVGNDNHGVIRDLSRPPSKSNSARQLTNRLAALWPLLIPKAEQELLTNGTLKRLIVIPDGPLALLPFETLVVDGEEDPEYLLDKGPPIAYGPSLTVLYNLATRTSPGQLNNKQVLSVADPEYRQTSPPATADSNPGSSLSDGAHYAGIGGKFDRLPFTAEESAAFAEVFTKAGMTPQILKREQATETNLRQNIGNRKIVHLACHGVTDQAYGNFFGALVLAPGTQSSTSLADDGFLTLPEIYELNLKGCELAILSACETNYGPQQQGEGVWALSRGFLVGGARRVVASNWLVDDEAGARLISYFSAAMADDETGNHSIDYSSRLHAAKKWTRSQSRWKSPYYWSTFVFVGPL